MLPTNPNQELTVCVALVGGLGNQMFGAAAGLALSRRLGARLEFDLGYFERQTFRRYALGVFDLPADIRSQSRQAHHTLRRRILKAASQGAPGSGGTGKVWRQRGFHYDDTFAALSDSVCLIGYFQSPKYFDGASDLIRASFDLQRHLSPAGRRLSEAAKGDDSVAVHVRCGDYITDTEVAAFHGNLSAEYYRRALRLVTRHICEPKLFVVSDSEDGARRLLAGFDEARFVSGTTPYDDMQLIASCRHRVIANSSFSWWGAWLDPRADGITVAPRLWFSREQMLNMYVGDLFPEGWFLT